jgi:hypothetical protein
MCELKHYYVAGCCNSRVLQFFKLFQNCYGDVGIQRRNCSVTVSVWMGVVGCVFSGVGACECLWMGGVRGDGYTACTTHVGPGSWGGWGGGFLGWRRVSVCGWVGVG